MQGGSLESESRLQDSPYHAGPEQGTSLGQSQSEGTLGRGRCHPPPPQRPVVGIATAACNSPVLVARPCQAPPCPTRPRQAPPGPARPWGPACGRRRLPPRPVPSSTAGAAPSHLQWPWHGFPHGHQKAPVQKGLWRGALQEARKAMSGAWPVSSPFFKAHIMFCSRPTGTTDCHVVPPRLFLMPRSFAVASLLSAKFPSFTIAEELALGAQVKKEKKERVVCAEIYSKSQFDPY